MNHDWNCVRYCILGKERELKILYNIDVKITGYELLQDCIYYDEYQNQMASTLWNGHGNRSKTLRRQIYEYWTFLNILEILLANSRQNRKFTVFYEPSSGGKRQNPIITMDNISIFVEPSLLPCSKKQILQKLQDHIRNQRILDEIKAVLKQKSRLHNTPDFLISNVNYLPWGALRIFGVFNDKVIEKTYEESEKWKEWWNYWNNIKNYSLIIECKNENLAINDLIQILWYRFCYDCEVILISQQRVNQAYKDIFESCNVYVLDQCKICEKICFDSLTKLLIHTK